MVRVVAAADVVAVEVGVETAVEVEEDEEAGMEVGVEGAAEVSVCAWAAADRDVPPR